MPPFRSFVLAGWLIGLETPMDDNMDDQAERMGPNPAHVAAPALRGVKNASPNGDTMEVGRDLLTFRVDNGLEQPAYAIQKGAIFGPRKQPRTWEYATRSGHIQWKSRNFSQKSRRSSIAADVSGTPPSPQWKRT